MSVRETHAVDRYKLISFSPTEEYWAWFRDRDGSLMCEKVDGIGVAKWWSVIFETQTGIELRSEYVGERVVGVYIDPEDGTLFAHDASNYVGIYRTGVLPPNDKETRLKYRLKEAHSFECDNPFSMPKGSLMMVTWTNDQKTKVLIDFGCGRCGLFDKSVLGLFEAVDQ